ncbi:MAG TPA: rhomboid family intramembrane serine protease [Myxococcota bacterium]|nr:rhomboid family intramembrane serine protease [Myxococcota bacterium]
MALICPKCLSDMSPIEHEGVTVDVCPGCRGIWLDPGELAFLRGADEDLPATPESIGAGDHYLKTSSYICPRCQGSFDTFEYAPGTGLYIDRCESCKGIYLDAGELKKIRQVTARKRILGLQTPNESQRKLHEFMQAERTRHARQASSDASSGSSGSSHSSAGVYFFQLMTGMPVEVDAKRQRFPLITLLIVLANVAVFLYQSIAVSDIGFYYARYAFIPTHLSDGSGWLGLFTGIFLHGGWLHLLGNMYFLWLFGDNVEERMNLGVFLIFYLACGVAASLLHGVLTESPGIPTLGASGAISGIMGAYLVLYPRRRMYQVIWFMQFKVSVAFYLLFWLGLQVLFSSTGSGGVAWYAHIGGFAVGAGGIWLLRSIGLVSPNHEATT